MKYYKCKYSDEDCERGKKIPEDKRLKIHSLSANSDGSARYIFKCPYCRGNLIELGDENAS